MHPENLLLKAIHGQMQQSLLIILKKMYGPGSVVIRMCYTMRWFIIKMVLSGIMHWIMEKQLEFMVKLVCLNLIRSLNWTSIYQDYLDGKKTDFTNMTTISRVKPIMSQTYPCYDGHDFNDQIRADAFIKELNEDEKKPGDQLPQLMVMALPNDHTAGMAPGFPTPRAMVADNDLALGRIIEALTKSRFWDSTVVFVTEDDSQDGWDHVSAYRTTGFVISPYSHLQKTVHTNYNQTCMVRTIEQILGLPPMNIMDATALPMFDCFSTTSSKACVFFCKK